MDRDAPNIIVDSMLAQGKLYEGTETVADMAERYDGVVTPWGNGWDHLGRVVVAINGIFYDPDSGVPETGMIQSGWYIKRFDDLGGGSGFAWKTDGNAFIGGCVYHEADQQIVTFIDHAESMRIKGINSEQRSSGIVIYTPQFDAHTHTGVRGVEVLVEVKGPVGITPLPRMAIGTIREVVREQGSTHIPFDHIVLSARGEAGRQLFDLAQVGERVGISQEITHLGSNCRSPHGWDWSQTFASIGGSFHFLDDGEIEPFEDNLGASKRNPRTMVCASDDFLYFVVVDGRQSGYSAGMTATEMGRFCAGTLEAEWGINQDGGGSSTMWIDGTIVNRPSDGAPRQVANGLMMVALEPIQRSVKFGSGESVLAIQPTTIRLGPGTNFGAISTIPADSSGIVLPHKNGLNGVLVHDVNWWRVAFDGVRGWVEEDNLLSQGGLAGRLRSLRELLQGITTDL
jgi:hypothetical protein